MIVLIVIIIGGSLLLGGLVFSLVTREELYRQSAEYYRKKDQARFMIEQIEKLPEE